MKEIHVNKLTENARNFAKNKVRWHFHFLTDDCIFNKKNKFAIVLENEETKESFVSYFDKKPNELMVFENLFYKRPENFNRYD